MTGEPPAAKTHTGPRENRRGETAASLQRHAPHTRAEVELRLLESLVLAVAEAADVSQAMLRLLEQLCAATGWEYGEAWLPDADGRQLRAMPVWHARRSDLARFQALSRDRTFARGEGLPGRVWATRRPEWLDDLSNRHLFLRAAAAGQTGLKTGVGIPVHSGGEVVAVFAFFMTRRRQKDERLLDLVLAALSPLGALIKLMRADEMVRRLNQELEQRVDERTAALRRVNADLQSEIGERKVAELELRKLTRAVEQSPNSILITDLDGNISYVNPAFTAITGFTPDQALGHTPRILKSGETPPAVYEEMWRTISGGSVWRGELTNRKQDGTCYSEFMSIAPVKGENGDTTHYVGIQTDITARKRVESTLHDLYRITTDQAQRLDEKLQAILELGCRQLGLPMAALTRIQGDTCEVVRAVDPQGTVAQGQTRALRSSFWGVAVDAEEPVAIEHAARSAWRDHPGYRAQRYEAYLGVRVTAGEEVYGALGFAGTGPRSQPFTTSDREILKLMALWIGSEIARQRSEEQARLHQAELAHVARLATMGEMASGLAHELNQPLTAIASYSEACLRMLRGGSGAVARLEEIIANISALALRGGEIIRRVRQLVSKQAVRKAEARLNLLVEEVMGLVESELRRRKITLRLELAENLPAVSVDPIQIEQVLLNLVWNAADAMAASDPRTLSVSTRRSSTDTVEVTVTDTGAGLDSDARARIFEPFYTSKSDGMGMGLSISRTIVEAHAGALEVESAPGAGTTMRLRLPL